MAATARSWVPGAALLLGLVALGVALNAWVDRPPGSLAASSSVRAVPPGRVWGASPFDEGAAVATPSRDRAVAPALELVGLDTRAHRRVATLRVDGGPPRRFVAGDLVAVGVRVTRILAGQVELQRGGAIAYLSLLPAGAINEPPASLAGATASASAPFEPRPIAPPLDQAPPSSSAIERAIARATRQ